MYYTTEQYILDRFNNAKRPLSFNAANIEEFKSWQSKLRTKLGELIGLNKMYNCSLNPTVISCEKLDGYTRTKMIIETEPTVFMPFYVLKPNTNKEKYPCVIATHGHCSNAKNAVVNLDEGSEQIRQTINEHNYSYGEQLVKQGFIVFAPDARGFGERREKYNQGDDFKNIISSSCSYLSALATPLGMSVIGMMVWDLMRLIDYIEINYDVIDIAVCGLSGGGMQALWLAALDKRVKAAVISGYFYGFKESLLEMHNCDCNYVHDLYNWVDTSDIGALIADRYIFIETGINDHLNGKSGLDNVLPYIEKLKKAGQICEMKNNIEHHLIDSGHRWCGQKSLPWLVNVIC